MSMVEEFMLLANVYAARFSFNAFKSCAVLRRHPPPTAEIFDDLKKKLEHFSVALDTTSNKALRESMDASGPLKPVL